ncbi:MAG: molecular chaperone [Dehalococcoidia bacterium]
MASSYPGTPLPRLAQARQAAYRFLADLFFYPEGERLSTLAQVAYVLERYPLLGFDLFPTWRRLFQALTALTTSDLPRLQEEYMRLFSRGTERAPLSPREGVCRGLLGADAGLLLARLLEHYRAADLTLSTAGYPPDHISVELEFMAFLCEREGQAWRRKDLAAGVAMLEQEKAFLEEHLVQWLPLLARALSQHNASSFYATVAEGAVAFVFHEQGLVNAVIEHLRRGTASPPKRR